MGTITQRSRRASPRLRPRNNRTEREHYDPGHLENPRFCAGCAPHTLLPQQGAPDEVFAAMTAQFSEAEIVNVTLAIGAINAWNRIGVGFALQHPHAAAKTVAA
jgi:alkylhydroperoxidase family enzyme